jgi:hypothetical protein
MPGGFDAQQQIRLDGALGWKEKKHDESEKDSQSAHPEDA